MTRTLHPVSAKVAIYTPDYAKVLVTEYLPGRFGLPGGHLDGDETPKQALVRELSEELGITLLSSDIIPQTFWKHDEGKIILGFTTILPEDTRFDLDPNEVQAIHWVDVADIKAGDAATRSYDRFILAGASSAAKQKQLV